MRARSFLHRRRFALPALIAALPILLAGVGHAAEHEKGMPQLNPASYASQIFWLAIFFILVFVFLRFVGLPRVMGIIAERGKRIGADIASAEALRAQAREAEQAYEAAMAEAHGKARQLLTETHERNVATLNAQTKSAAASFDAKVDEAVKRIDAARAEALQGIREVARGLAADITVKLSGHAPAADSVARAVEDAAGREAA
jgi:F-type H+-transporting ATPase subunit b